MKKTVTATITKTFEIEIKDELLTPEAITEFEESFFEVSGIDELFGYAAVQIARFDNHFVDGFGEAEMSFIKKDTAIKFKEISFDTDYEIEANDN